MNPFTSMQYWLSERSLTPLHNLNGSVIGLMYDQSRLEQHASAALRLPVAIRQELARSSLEHRQRIAHTPTLLVDLHFDDATWWHRVTLPLRREPGRASLRRLCYGPRLLALNRATLHFAWHVARQDRTGAMVLLGMSDAVTTFMTQVNPLDIDRYADRTVLDLRPRWLDQPTLWHHLLVEPGGGSAERLARLQSLQLLGACPTPAAR